MLKTFALSLLAASVVGLSIEKKTMKAVDKPMAANRSNKSAIGEKLATIEGDISKVDKKPKDYDKLFAGRFYESDDAEEKFSSVWA